MHICILGDQYETNYKRKRIFLGWVYGWNSIRYYVRNDDINNMIVTLCGIDYYAKTVCKEINIWKDYNNRDRGVIKRYKHGKRLKVVEEFVEYVRVRVGLFRSGYVNKLFIKEMKYEQSYFREVNKWGAGNRPAKRKGQNRQASKNIKSSSK